MTNCYPVPVRFFSPAAPACWCCSVLPCISVLPMEPRRSKRQRTTPAAAAVAPSASANTAALASFKVQRLVSREKAQNAKKKGAAASAKRSCCSFAKHGETFREQPFYECVTCELTLENGTGICRACKRTCHAGHDVGFVGRIKAYCDCGKNGCALAKDTSAEAIAAVESDETSDEEEEGGVDGSAFVDPRLARNYGDKNFWDERYAANAEAGDDTVDEWLVGWPDIEHVLKPQLDTLTASAASSSAAAAAAPAKRSKRSKGAAAAAGRPSGGGPRLLMLGCGDSDFSGDLYDSGFPNIVNVDISKVCIDTMRKRNKKDRPEMVWEVADCTDLSQFEDDSFDAVIDKTLLDALCCSSDAVDIVPKMLAEVGRVLKPNGGQYMIISFSLESAKASFEQAVLSEAVFAAYKPLIPQVSMVVSANEDDHAVSARNVTAAAAAAATAG